MAPHGKLERSNKSFRIFRGEGTKYALPRRKAMKDRDLNSRILGLSESWFLADIGRVDIHAEHAAGNLVAHSDLWPRTGLPERCRASGVASVRRPPVQDLSLCPGPACGNRNREHSKTAICFFRGGLDFLSQACLDAVTPGKHGRGCPKAGNPFFLQQPRLGDSVRPSGTRPAYSSSPQAFALRAIFLRMFFHSPFTLNMDSGRAASIFL